jgi:hypothetical protein
LLGFEKDLELHKEWLNAMLLHADAFPSPNTIDALFRYYSTTAGSFQYVTIIPLLILYIVFVGINIINNKKEEKANSSGFIMEWFVLIALMPSMFKTDTEHFLMSLPVILFLLIYLSQNKNRFLTILFIILVILYAGNSSDLLGKSLSQKMYDMGVLGIGNLLIVSLALFVYFKYTRKTNLLERLDSLSDTKLSEDISK